MGDLTAQGGLERNGLCVCFWRRVIREGVKVRVLPSFKKTMAVRSTCSDLKCWSASMLGGHCQGSQKPYFFGRGSLNYHELPIFLGGNQTMQIYMVILKGFSLCIQLYGNFEGFPRNSTLFGLG